MFRLGHIAVASAVLSGLLVFTEAANHGAVAEAVASDKVAVEGARKADLVVSSVEVQAPEKDSACRPAVRVVYAGAVSAQRPCASK